MLTSGSRLGPYEVLSAAGAGGMGEVYKARDTRLDRVVAIKVLPAGIADAPELRDRFDRAARTIASLTHPHICTLYDVATIRHGLPGTRVPGRGDAGAAPKERCRSPRPSPLPSRLPTRSPPRTAPASFTASRMRLP